MSNILFDFVATLCHRHISFIFQPISLKFGTDVEQVMVLKFVSSKILMVIWRPSDAYYLKVTMWGRCATKYMPKIMEKVYYMNVLHLSWWNY